MKNYSLLIGITIYSSSLLAADYNASTYTPGSTTLATNDSVTIANSSTLTTASTNTIYTPASVSNVTITNNGSISNTSSGFGTIAAHSTSSDVTIINSGTISAAGASAVSGSANFSLTNKAGATISTTGSATVLLGTIASNASVNNAGTISADNNMAISAKRSSNANITNSGTIQALALDSGTGYEAIRLGTATTLTNSGTIKSTGSNGIAIKADNNNATITLQEGSVIIGDIVISAGMTGTSLNMDVGSARSYVYSVTDNSASWTLTDLDGRTAIQGSAKAAGIGIVETADDRLYHRHQAVNHSLSQYLNDPTIGGTWVDIYGQQNNRKADATVNKYQQQQAGFTVIKPLSNATSLVLGAQQNTMDISDKVQTIDTSNMLIGLVRQGQHVNLKALLSYSNNDTEQQVLDNTSSTGYSTYKGSFNAYGVSLGLSKESLLKQSDSGHLVLNMSADINYEQQANYQETATFSWDKRTLAQAAFDMNISWQKSWQVMDVYATLGAKGHKLLSGDQASYKIDSTSTSYTDSNNQVTEGYASAGIKVSMGNQSSLHLHMQTSSDTTNVSLRLSSQF